MKNKKVFFTELGVVLLAGFIASIPLLFKGIDGTIYQDLQFHLSRTEGIKEGLKAGEFPTMMQSVWMNGKGYPVSIFYGDLLLYFPALLRLIGIPVVAAYKIFVWCTNFLTAFVALVCFKRITLKMGFGAGSASNSGNDLTDFKDKAVRGSCISAYVATFLYVTASYRLMDVYVRAAVGEYLSFIFFPIVALAMVNILDGDIEDKRYVWNSLLLAAGMTGLLETHLLSTVMTAFLLAIVCVLCFKRTFRKRTIICILAAVGETLLVNLYFLVPFADYYINEPVYAGKGGDHTSAMQIRSSGAYISQFGDFFGHIFGRNVEDVKLRMQLTVGLALTLSLIACFVLFVVKYRKYKVFVLGAMSVLTLFMATNLFPWNSLEGYTRLFKLLSKVQFPWRYLAAAVFFISVLTAIILSGLYRDKEKLGIIAASVLVLAALSTTVSFASNYKKDYYRVDYKTYDEIDSGYMGACEYLKPGTELIITEYVPENSHLDSYSVVANRDNSVTVNVVNKGEASVVQVPKLNYKGYVARDSEGKRLAVSNGYLNLINVEVPAGYSGNITVAFKQPALWRIAEIISLLGVIGLIVIYRKSGRVQKQA